MFGLIWLLIKPKFVPLTGSTWPMKSWHLFRGGPLSNGSNNVSVRVWTRENVENNSVLHEKRAHSHKGKYSMVKRELKYLEFPWFFTTVLTVNNSLRWSKGTPISCNQESSSSLLLSMFHRPVALASSIGNLLKNVVSQALPQTHWIRTCKHIKFWEASF